MMLAWWTMPFFPSFAIWWTRVIFLLFSCPPIPAIVFTDTIGIWKVTSLWLLYPLLLLWWMFSVSSWPVLDCDYLDVLEPFLGFPLAFLFFIFYIHCVFTMTVCIVYRRYFFNDSSCMDDDSLYRVSTILFLSIHHILIMTICVVY